MPLNPDEMTNFDRWALTAPDPGRTIDGRTVPVITSLLYVVCDGNSPRFDEAMRLMQLAYNAGFKEGDGQP